MTFPAPVLEILERPKGLTPDEARRQALTAFGRVEKHKEALPYRCGLSSALRIRLTAQRSG